MEDSVLSVLIAFAYGLFVLGFAIGMGALIAMLTPLVPVAGLLGALAVRRHPFVAGFAAAAMTFIALGGPHGNGYAGLEGADLAFRLVLFGVDGGLVGGSIGVFVGMFRSLASRDPSEVSGGLQ